jgi:HEAT repeat protein
MHASTVVPALIEALEDSGKVPGWIIVNLLGEIQDPAAVPALIRALQTTDARVRPSRHDSFG